MHAAGVAPSVIEEGARKLLAEARGHQLAEARKQLGFGQKDVAAAMEVSVARVSQIEHGEVTSIEVIARYVEALGARPFRMDEQPVPNNNPIYGCPKNG